MESTTNDMDMVGMSGTPTPRPVPTLNSRSVPTAQIQIPISGFETGGYGSESSTPTPTQTPSSNKTPSMLQMAMEREMQRRRMSGEGMHTHSHRSSGSLGAGGLTMARRSSGSMRNSATERKLLTGENGSGSGRLLNHRSFSGSGPMMRTTSNTNNGDRHDNGASDAIKAEQKVKQQHANSNRLLMNHIPLTGNNNTPAGGNPASHNNKKKELPRTRVGKRLRRVLNDMYLQRCAHKVRSERGEDPEYLDVNELKQLFQVHHRSIFAELHESKSAAELFKPFTDISEDRERELLFPDKNPSHPEQRRVEDQSPEARYLCIDRKIRAMLQLKFGVLQELIVDVEKSISRSRLDRPNASIQFELEDGFHRLAVHGVSQYYHMKSCTQRTRGEASCVINIYATESSIESAPACSLHEYLSRLAA
eukprot:CAMPEP_0184697248 /NCGR_PEP_ID=MMETSP0313-20130426/4266_1 /TAXON_ID=2792 /ORGANISM="Porphyridium aerugineum, Strain SAG 1380-2" /LENGTH=420 /DNA_ID=CAMNT_0027156013 /DNA_START=83 /DNA_END=1345 /DNA_ORIENTATION=-